MRKFLTTIILLIFSSAIFAQSPYVIPRDLRLGGNLKVTAGTQTGSGTIRYVNGHFEFNQNGTWMRYDTLGGALPVTKLPWDSITGKPLTFPPSAHTQDWSTITNPPATYAPSAHTQDWTTITGKPTIFPTDTNHKVQWVDILGIPGSFTPAAHTQDWTTITGKPTEFTPSAHTQSWTTITDVPATFTPSAHTQDWTTITGKPTEFTPSAHTQDWTTITGKPTEFTPAAHTQSWTTITDKPLTFPPSTHTHNDLLNPYDGRLTFTNYEQTVPGGGGGGSTSDSTFYTFPTWAGSTVYIDPDTDPVGDGTIGNPYDSWTDVTWVANRTYLQMRGTTWTGGALAEVTVGPIKIGAYGDTTLPRPIMKANYSTNSNLLHFNGGYGIVKDMDIQNTATAGTALRFRNGPYNWVYNCKITGFGNGIVGYRTGTLARSAANAWEYLKILYTEVSGQYTDAIFIDNVTDIEVAHCNIHDWNAAYQSNQNDATSSGDGVQIQTHHAHVNIHHTIFKRNAAWGNKFCLITYSDPAPGYVRAEIWKNTFLGANAPATSAYYVNWSDSTINVYNNTFDAFSNYAIYNYGENTRFYYNLVTSTRIPLVSHDDASGTGKLILFNNIFYGSQTAALAFNSANAITTSYNNVFMAGTTYPNAVAYTGVQGTFTSNYNHFVNNVTSTQTLVQWQGATVHDDNSAAGDALFQGAPANFRPTAITSPLLASGTLYDATVKDFDWTTVTNPVSKGLYQSATPPPPPGGGGDPTLITIDSVLTSNYHIFGDYQNGNFAMFDSTGNLSFHGNANFELDVATLPLAYGNDNQIQYAEGGMLRSEAGFEYDNTTNRLTADTVAVTRLAFSDGTVLETVPAGSSLPAGMTYQTQKTLAFAAELPFGEAPDDLYISTGSVSTNSDITLTHPLGYIPIMLHIKASTSANVDYTVGTTTVSQAVTTGNKYSMAIGTINYSWAQEVHIVTTNNEGPGLEFVAEYKKSPFFVNIPNTPPYLSDGLTTGWFAMDTATYYDLNTTNVIRLYDKVGRKALGADLISPVDFTSGWTAAGATPTGALTFNTAAAGGMNKNININTRGIYRMVANGSTTGGTLAFHNSNNSTNNMGTISGSTTIDFTSTNIYAYFRNSAAGDATFVSSPSIKRFTGNHLVQVTDANRPTISGGIMSFDASDDYLISAISPTISMQKIYIVAQINNGGYKLYTSLTGIGELSTGVLTLGANAALNTFYDVDIKELVIRNDANATNDNMFKDYLMYKYNVTLAP